MAINKIKLTRTIALAFLGALVIFSVSLSQADNAPQLTVNVTDACGPVVAQATIVNDPDDGAFGITNSSGSFTFQNLRPGVFYLHIAADGHQSKDTDAIVLT